jgi:diphosphomevalonate decarboxylase
MDDVVVLDGEAQPAERFGDFFAALRAKLGPNLRFWAESANNFPTAAGLASSSSGFAALSLACAHAAAKSPPSPQTLSALARLGSGSAARSLFGGFTLLPAQAESAQSLYPAGTGRYGIQPRAHAGCGQGEGGLCGNDAAFSG